MLVAILPTYGKYRTFAASLPEAHYGLQESERTQAHQMVRLPRPGYTRLLGDWKSIEFLPYHDEAVRSCAEHALSVSIETAFVWQALNSGCRL